jgi:hypothetical protein
MPKHARVEQHQRAERSIGKSGGDDPVWTVPSNLKPNL